MEGGAKQHGRALVLSPEYEQERQRLVPKFRGQVARKALDLASDPRPGGSRTALKGYDGLYRVRAGKYRIIYAFNDEVVQLLTLRRRDERTYDKLDELEVAQLQSFQSISGPSKDSYDIPQWEELAKQWAAPKPKPAEPLPQPITEAMLAELNIPEPHRATLLGATTVDGLLNCDVPAEYVDEVVDRLCPRRQAPAAQAPTPVVVMDDLVDPVAAVATGPIDAARTNGDRPTEVQVHDANGERQDDGDGEKSGLPVLVRIPRPLVLTPAKQREPMQPYRGNTSWGVGQDTHYTVKLDGTIRLVYAVGHNERALLTTDGHPELVEMVNEAKRRGGASQGGGGFLINEFRHVLVPTQTKGVLYAGVYTRDLEFEFEGTTISPVAPSNIRPGQEWPGPHVGIKYTLAASATDVRYDEQTARGTIRRECLKDHHSADALAGLLRMLKAVKPNGGAIYVNEAREIFAPVNDGNGYQRRYVGHLGSKPWFAEPM